MTQLLLHAPRIQLLDLLRNHHGIQAKLLLRGGALILLRHLLPHGLLLLENRGTSQLPTAQADFHALELLLGVHLHVSIADGSVVLVLLQLLPILRHSSRLRLWILLCARLLLRGCATIVRVLVVALTLHGFGRSLLARSRIGA